MLLILFHVEPFSVVIEFVSGGSLDKLLIKSRVTPVDDDLLYMNIRSRLTERELLDISLGVVKGMCHLERKEVGIHICQLTVFQYLSPQCRS